MNERADLRQCVMVSLNRFN